MELPQETWMVSVEADTRPLQAGLASAASYGRQFGRTLSSAFSGIALQGKSLGNVIRSLALDLSRLTLRAAFKPLENALGGFVNNLVSGGFSTGGLATLKPALSTPVPFASGGVISSPIAFPLAGGKAGIAGEQGPEAIMPLTRGADGRLGVKAQEGRAISITFNVSTPDAESFRRTESQITAMLARAADRGQRNL